MKAQIIAFVMLSILIASAIAFAEESLKDHDGDAVFNQDVEDDRLLA